MHLVDLCAAWGLDLKPNVPFAQLISWEGGGRGGGSIGRLTNVKSQGCMSALSHMWAVVSRPDFFRWISDSSKTLLQL